MIRGLYKKTLAIMLVFLLSAMIFGPTINAEFVVEKTIEKNVEDDTSDLLIITYGSFKRALQPLVEHKNTMGVKTSMFTLSQVYDEIDYGRDNPEKIKV